MTGGHAAHPGDTERLHEYWVHGDGAAKIRWGEPGDFQRCVDHLGKYIDDAAGYCNLAHKAALGIYPATHAAEIKKATGRSSVTVTQRAQMTSASINDLPDSAFAYIEPGGTKDASGRTIPRDKRHFPVHDKAHVQNALSQAPKSPFGDKAMPKIKAAAKRLGVDVSDGDSDSSEGAKDKASASRAVQEIRRDCQLEDIHIVRAAEGDSTGRLVEAYAAVFDQPAVIRDHQGHYEEEIDRAAFDERLTQIRRSGRSLASSLRVLYNHGRTAEGDPAPEFQKPLGKPVSVTPEGRGLLTRTEYAKTPHAEEVLELIKGGSITAQSFVGTINRSDPELRGPGDKYRARNGTLTRVRRLALGLREYGPVLWEAYSGAEILGVRMALPGAYEDFDLTPDEEYASANEEDVAGSVPEDTTSARYHQHALYRMTSEEKRKAAGLDW